MLSIYNHSIKSITHLTLNLSRVNTSTIFASISKKMKTLIQTLTIALFTASTAISSAQSIRDTVKKEPVNTTTAEKKSEWYQKISLRGYVQARYNRLLETNGQVRNEQGDRSIGSNGGLFLRRVRVILSGQVHKKVYFYIQPDFASSASSDNLHFGQLRDAYFDLGIDNDNEFRFRVGQSKVPFGFENMQSSQNRLPLDRNDGLNSALSNERDLGVFFYWAPKETRELFATLVSSGLKGSGDYGVFAFGAFNGQTANKPEANNTPHIVSRLTYPVKIGKKQIIEPGIQAYSGKYVVTSLTTGVVSKTKNEFKDQRVAATFVLYPQPFGIQAEYNWGTGPEFVSNGANGKGQIAQRHLEGGYVTASYLTKAGNQILIPFTRYHYYDGGKKHEIDARSYNVRELELGLEWQPHKNFELVTEYTLTKRKFEDAAKPINWQKGNLLRIQAQLNF